MNNKKKTLICFPLIVLFCLTLSCKNPVSNSVPPDVGVKQENSYTVSYNANGGKGQMKASVFTVGAWKNLPSNTFTRENYVFSGWAVSAGGEVKYTNKAAVKNLAAGAGEPIGAAGTGAQATVLVQGGYVHNIYFGC